MNLENIKNLGAKNIKLLNKLKIYNSIDLLEHYPYKYNFIKFMKLEEFNSDTLGYLQVIVSSNPTVNYIKKNLNRLTFTGMYNGINLRVTIFNRQFLRTKIKIGDTITLYGKFDNLKNNFTARDIRFDLENNFIEPVYHLTDGLTHNILTKYINYLLENNIDFIDKIPSYINEDYKLINKKEALQFIHNPNNITEIKKARIKLIYEELFIFMTKINFLKMNNDVEKGIERNIADTYESEFYSVLNFKPTSDQEIAFKEIKKDMTSKKKMTRLVLGDVGSGKTLTAMYAIYLNKASNYQSAFMAPTELLALQHFKSCVELFKNLNIRIEIITGKMSKREKDKIKDRLKTGEIDLLIGTHSLISDDIIFKNLGLVITDEEHRFGVIQRKNLENKGINPDVLYLSATPIPRTYAKVIYKDTDVSIIKTKPSGRKEIFTKIIHEDDIRLVLKKMLLEINEGHQIFVVSPLIENAESELNSVIDLKEKFSKAFLNKARIEIIHGGMKNAEKDAIMHDFSIGKIDILISTTIIEVGIDIPNATVMAIYNAERFGLATLHQLRGRVGRSDKNSFCFLISNSKDNNRLSVMEESNDGFYITEKDFEERKEGDLFGTIQSGEKIFKLANMKNDYQILLQASKDAEKFVSEKKYLNDKFYLDIYENIKKSI